MTTNPPYELYPDYLNQVFDEFGKKNIEAWLIGPRARDLAAELSIIDAASFDLTVDAALATIESIFFELFSVEPQTSKDDRPKLLTFKVPKTDDDGYVTFNVGPFRNYLPPLRSLRGQNLTGIILDLATREVTVQAFAYDSQGDMIDPFGGSLDFADKLIRPVFPVDTLFRESASWLLKIARYVGRYGFDAAKEVRTAADRDAANILDVPRDIWRKEMDKILCGAHPGKGLQFLAESRVLSFILPEIQAMYAFGDGGNQHKNIWAHTKQVVSNSDATPVVRWAAMCHDMGKVWTKQVFRDDKIHFFRHEDMSALLFEGIAKRFDIVGEDYERIHYIVKNHGRVNLYRDDWTDSAVRRLIKDVGDALDDLIAFSKADLTSKRADRVEMIRALLADLQIRVMDVREQDALVQPLPKGLGTQIMERFDIPAGPKVGQLRNMLIHAIEIGNLEPNQDSEVYLSYLADLLVDSNQDD